MLTPYDFFLRHIPRISKLLIRNESSWMDGVFPKEHFTKTLVRSSGPGGQNVNKVATKVEIRFNVNDANWLEQDVRDKFIKRERNRINKRGEFAISSDKTRHAEENEDDCYERLKSILNECLRQIEYENRQPTEEDIEILDKRTENAQLKRRQLKQALKTKRKMRSSDF